MLTNLEKEELLKTVPAGYVTGVSRKSGGENKLTHLYKGTFHDMEGAMCKDGYNDGEDGWSIFRNNISNKGLCKTCMKRAKQNLEVI